jgi:hypothetical protein
MNIGFDFDGCIANMYEEMAIRLEKAGYKTDTSKWDSYSIEENHPEVPVPWIIEQFADPTFWLNAQPYDDAWYMLNKWFGDGHNIYIITCRSAREYDVSYRWLEEWNVNYNQLFCGALKYHKNSYIDKLQLDIFIEDNPIEVTKLAETIPTFLLDRPYNSRYDIGGAVRVSDCYALNETLEQWQKDLDALNVWFHTT